MKASAWYHPAGRWAKPPRRRDAPTPGGRCPRSENGAASAAVEYTESEIKSRFSEALKRARDGETCRRASPDKAREAGRESRVAEKPNNLGYGAAHGDAGSFGLFQATSEDGMLNGLGLTQWAWSGRDGLELSELVAAQLRALRWGNCALRNPPENDQPFLGRLHGARPLARPRYDAVHKAEGRRTAGVRSVQTESGA